MARKSKKNVEVVNEEVVSEVVEVVATEEVTDTNEVVTEEVTEETTEEKMSLTQIKKAIERLDLDLEKIKQKKDQLFIKHHKSCLEGMYTKKFLKTLDSEVNHDEEFIVVMTDIPNTDQTFITKYELTSENPFEDVTKEYVTA
jgi:signal transduction protein with GAF and PtsI domain